MNIIQRREIIHSSKKEQNDNIQSINSNNASNKLAIVSKEKSAFYERFQKENIDFIKTLLRLKQANPNSYTNTNANDNPKKAQNPIKENIESPNRRLLLNHYPKPYQPLISSSSKPKRTKSRSIIRTNNDISTPITPIKRIDRQKCFFAPFLQNQILTAEKQSLISSGLSNHKTCIIPRYTPGIQRTNSSSAINQSSMPNQSSNANNENDRSKSLRNKKKRISISTTIPTRASSCMGSQKKIMQNKAPQSPQKYDCNIISIIHNKKKETKNVSSYSNTTPDLSQPNLIQKPIMIYRLPIEKQRQDIPTAEIDLFIADENQSKPKQINEDDDINHILTKQLSTSSNNKHRFFRRKTNNKSFNDIKPQKRSLSFIENIPSSPQEIDNPIDKIKGNTTIAQNKSSYKFEQRKNKKIDH